MIRLCFVAASRAFCVNVSYWAVRRVICSVRDRWTVFSCAIAVSEGVICVNGEFEERNLIAYISKET